MATPIRVSLPPSSLILILLPSFNLASIFLYTLILTHSISHMKTLKLMVEDLFVSSMKSQIEWVQPSLSLHPVNQSILLARTRSEETQPSRVTSALSGVPSKSKSMLPSLPPSKASLRTPMVIPPIDPPSKKQTNKRSYGTG
ncbi:hypothetical protein HanIR_Chr03g0118001 [Helianthus annuus]|nr:hypothetical protein HanIR_Chr03g0118001 [Helianthus annuus]